MTLCAYCKIRPAIHWDHIVSKADRKRQRPDKSFVYPGDWENEKVPACFACNIYKSTRHLVPEGYERLEELQAINSNWREWKGSTDEPAFRDTHK